MESYLTFLGIALVVVVVPGPDTFITLKNAVAGGPRTGLWTTLGVLIAGAIQGLVAAAGLGALIQAAEPVFLTIKWVGVAYLMFLGAIAIRDASRAAPLAPAGAPNRRRRRALTPGRAARQGFLTNITNPKVLAFNLALLPQFVGPDAGIVHLVPYALTLAGFGAIFLAVVAVGAGLFARVLARNRVRRGIEAGTGVVFIAFAGLLAVEGTEAH